MVSYTGDHFTNDSYNDLMIVPNPSFNNMSPMRHIKPSTASPSSPKAPEPTQQDPEP
jgi:hypothetical protein